jgi:hypothetical protein
MYCRSFGSATFENEANINKRKNQYKKITYYDFDLDLEPKSRWSHIFDFFQEKLQPLKEYILHIFDQYESIVNYAKNLSYFHDKNKILFYDEIFYISERMKLEVYQIILLQLFCEISTSCTSGIFTINKKNYFLYTTDFIQEKFIDPPAKVEENLKLNSFKNGNLLKNVTIGLNIKKNNKIISRVIGWLGCIGFSNATTNSYIITINSRRTNEINIFSIIENSLKTLDKNWPVSYLVRHSIELQLDRIDTIKLFKEEILISPVYITICARENMLINVRNSIIITRDLNKIINIRAGRKIECKTRNIRSHNLIQTNYDIGQNNILNDMCAPCNVYQTSPFGRRSLHQGGVLTTQSDVSPSVRVSLSKVASQKDLYMSLDFNRRILFEIIVNKLKKDTRYISEKYIIQKLLKYPILNENTVYIYFSSGKKCAIFV